MLAQMFSRHFCDTLPSHRDRVADDLEQPGRKKRMNDKKRHVLCFGLSLANVLKYSRWLDYHETALTIILERSAVGKFFQSVHNWLLSRFLIKSNRRACFQCIAFPATMLITNMSDTSTFFTACDTNCSYPIIQKRCIVTHTGGISAKHEKSWQQKSSVSV